MTIMMAIAAGGGGLVVPAIVLSDTNNSRPDPWIQISADGTMYAQGIASSCTPPNWYLPATAGIGAIFWLKLVLNSGTPPAQLTPNTIYSLGGSTLIYEWPLTTVGTITANATLIW